MIMMSIWIENLGGYDAAKVELDRLKSIKDGSSIADATIQTLEYYLLEYKRANNIFEKGDKVVHIYDSENSMLFTVKDITDRGYSFGNDWGWRGVISNMGVGHAFRHATPEEIQAGCRL